MGTRKNGGCQVIGEGGGKRFSGAFRAGAPSPLACLPLARPFSLSPTTSKRLLHRLLRNLLFLSRQQCRFTTLFKFLVYFIYNNFYYWISIKGFSKHELSTINMLYSLKKIVILHSYLPIGQLPLPQGWPLWRGSAVYPFPVCLLEVRERSLFITGGGGGGWRNMGLNKVQFSRFPL